MEEGAEGSEARQAGPPGVHLIPDPTAPSDPALPGNGGPPVPMSEATDVRTVSSPHDPVMSETRVNDGFTHRWASTAPYVIVAAVAMWLSRSFWFPGRYVVGFDTYAYSGPNVEVTEAAWRDFRLPILNDLIFGHTGPRGGRHEGMLESAAKSAARSVGSGLGRQILRGVLGSIFGGRR